jgi:tRNA pseudouridine38-40 synthase
MAVVEYDGTDFAGFQLQAHASAPQPRTVQAVLESAVAPLAGDPGPPRITGAGRTDAGVHAAAQVVHLDTAGPLASDPPAFLRAWNARLPADVRVRSVSPATPDFHARRSARSRTYRYRIVNAPLCSPFLHRYAHHVRDPLSLPQMAAAAGLLLGEHDFRAFAAGEGPGLTRRHVWRVDVREGWETGPGIWHTLGQWVAQPPATLWAPLPGEADPVRIVTVEVEANAFLRHMVRRVVGTLVEVGLGRLPPPGMASILAAGDKRNATQAAPARGLCLWRVRYEGLPPETGGSAGAAAGADQADQADQAGRAGNPAGPEQ